MSGDPHHTGSDAANGPSAAPTKSASARPSSHPAERDLLRHFIAALAYRTGKAVREAPPGFSTFDAGRGVRTPHQIVHHMSGVLSYALSRFEPMDTWFDELDDWNAEVDRFFSVMTRLASTLATGSFNNTTTARLLQGPMSDAMTHAGQLAMLRRLHGHPIPPENFHEADIRGNRVGIDQPDPVSPDAVWRDADGRIRGRG